MGSEVHRVLNVSALEGLQQPLGISGIRRQPTWARSSRTLAALAVLTVLNIFDVALTHSQMARGNFAEANLIARSVANTPGGMTFYKTTLFGLGVYILYRYRRCWQSEAALWGLTACYAGLMVWWQVYLDLVEICAQDVVVDPPLAFF